MVKVHRNEGYRKKKCVNRAKPTSNEVIQGFGSVIQKQSILINDGLFSNYELIKQNELTSVVVSEHHEFTSTIHLNTINNMHSGFKQLYRHYRGWGFDQISQSLSRTLYLHASLYGHG